MEVKEYVKLRKEELRQEVLAMPHTPKLIIIQANDNPASDAYIRGKLKDSAEIGFVGVLDKRDPSISEEELLKVVKQYNEDPSVDGLIVQLPLPSHISEAKVKLAVDPKKDVDGFHPTTGFAPCTPKGIVDYLTAEGFAFRGKNAVVLGRSNIVGKPMAKMLLAKDCNVTVLHSKTSEEDKRFYIAHADLIVIAIGRLGYLNASYQYKEDAVIVDVGINRGEDGKLHGDAEPGLPVKLQTPVPGGVGLLTRLALMDNLVEAMNK
jgi:methylenetetrahydrofolate dehydrogenase (NADP+)/methenyltetrahydrofolate cyclohydrolase